MFPGPVNKLNILVLTIVKLCVLRSLSKLRPGGYFGYFGNKLEVGEFGPRGRIDVTLCLTRDQGWTQK